MTDNFKTLNTLREGAVLFAEIAGPPMNLLGPELVRDMVSLIQSAEADDDLQVLVFKSADPDYFISHVDVTRIKDYRQEAEKLTGEPSIAIMFRYLSASRLVTIAQIEGRVRGAGGEFVLACDMRFADTTNRIVWLSVTSRIYQIRRLLLLRTGEDRKSMDWYRAQVDSIVCCLGG